MRNMLHDILDMGFSQWQEKLTAMGGEMKEIHRLQPSLSCLRC